MRNPVISFFGAARLVWRTILVVWLARPERTFFLSFHVSVFPRLKPFTGV